MSRLVKPPADPVANARLFLKDRYTRSGVSVLRSHGGVVRVWSGSAWPELAANDLTSEIYVYFEDAKYIDMTTKGQRRVPFLPTRAKVGEIEKAISAVNHLPGGRPMPFWIEGERNVINLDPHELIPMANGLLQVGDRKLHPASPSFFCAYSLPYEYNPDAPAPERFLRLMDEYWPDDQESKDLLQEFIGYLLVADTSQQKMLLIVGPPRSGKGTISRLITDLLGRHNVAGPTLASLATNFGLQPLIDKQIAIISDARLSGRNNPIVVERLLSISGEDPLTIDRKYKSPVTGPLPCRIVILTNELPQFDESSGALANRFLILKTEHSFLGNEDPGLSAALAKELSGILLLALDGLERLRERGHFIQPQNSIEILNDLEELSSPIRAFTNEICILGPFRTVAIDDLFGEWCHWCQQNGSLPGSKQSFGRDLRSVVPGLETPQERQSDGSRHRLYRGIGLARDGTRS